MNHVYGFFLLAVCCILSLFVSPLFFLLGVAAFFYLVFYEQQRLDRKAEDLRNQISFELPRFLDLLQTELQVGLPVETAIEILSRRVDSLISREFQESMNETELGATTWPQALEGVASKYNIETLSDFVMEITTAYRKGVSISDAVARKTKEIKATHLLNVKEKAGKTTNTILIPMVIFQFLPMIAFILLPVFAQVSSGLL